MDIVLREVGYLVLLIKHFISEIDLSGNNDFVGAQQTQSTREEKEIDLKIVGPFTSSK